MIIEKEENIKNYIDNKTTIYYYIVNEDKVVKVTYDRDLLGTRKDWLKSNDKDRKNELNKEQENYEILTNKEVNNKHDKTYRSNRNDRSRCDKKRSTKRNTKRNK